MKLRELFSDESKWTKGDYARNAAGESVEVMSPAATCFCLSGAIELLHPPEHGVFPTDARITLVNKIAVYIGARTNTPVSRTRIPEWNDSVSFAEIRRMVEALDI